MSEKMPVPLGDNDEISLIARGDRVDVEITRAERIPPSLLEDRYRGLCATTSDINEHLPTLRRLASECEHVTEFGMRGGVSTCALLAAQPKVLISWDINPYAVVSQVSADLVALSGRTLFQPRVGDTLEISPIEKTDMLFIDSLHVAKHLLKELMRHADPGTNNVRRYLVFHDTVSFGHKGEDGSVPGLRDAIRWFQSKWALPVWQLVEDHKNNNGLAVLRNCRPMDWREK